ncbi:MAG: M12 family metallo-peptidase, partial [Planctomycetota bacterium]
YLRDVDVTLLISYLRVWADANDLWTHSSIFDQLDQFQDYYEANMQDVERHTAHFLSGRALSGAGGVAYLPGLCNGEWAYGLSAHLNGSFPYPLEDNNPQNWDVVVVAHELGHNFGAPHTHSMDPPIDECAYGDCTGADEGTIMSYCHTCDGGIANIVLIFHQRIIDEEIIPYLESGLDCTLAPAAANILLHPQGATVCVGDPVTFSVAAEGEPPLSFQWRKNGVDLIGANSTTYQITAATFAHAGSYDVVVTNVCGDTFSDPAVLVVNDCSADCPWDCQATPDGSVNVADFLAILAQWGQYGTSCDFDGYGVGVADFLAVLAHWGYCPAR